MVVEKEIIDSLKLESQACFPLYALSREIINAYRPLLEEIDLTYPQYLVLMVLWENGIKTVNQLGAKLHLDSGTLTPLLKRMESKNLLQRKRSLTDERVVELSLTEQGISLKEQAKDIPFKLMENLQITMEEAQQLRQITYKILDRVCLKDLD